MKKRKIILLLMTVMFFYSVFFIFSNSGVEASNSLNDTLVYVKIVYDGYNNAVKASNTLKNSVISFVGDFVEVKPTESKVNEDIPAAPTVTAPVSPKQDNPPEEPAKEEKPVTNDYYKGMPRPLYKLVRKVGHFIEFAAMSFLLSFTVYTCFSAFVSWRMLAVGLFCAVCDELMQNFTPSRDPRIADVVIDFGGVIMGVVAGYIIIKILSKKAPRLI